MGKKFYTCIIVPDASHRLHKLRIPTQIVYVLAAVGIISFFTAVALGFSYVHMAFKVADYDTLEAQNAELKIETLNLEVSAKKLSSKIEELEDLSERLTEVIESGALIAGVTRLNVNGTGGSRTDFPTSELIGGADAGSRTSLKDDVASMRDRTVELEEHLRLLEQLTEHQLTAIRYTPTLWPLQGRIGSYYGTRRDPFTGAPETHFGIDISAPFGSAIQAPADGQVMVAQRRADYGNLIILDHGNGMTTRYGHLSRFGVLAGQTIRKGDVIGYVGLTGRTTAPHLHYEVRVNDRPVNPRNYLPRGE